MLRAICTDFPDVHVVAPQFLVKLQRQGWDQAKNFFRNRTDESKGSLNNRKLCAASLDASVLVIPVHGSAHWNPLIRDARGVGIEKARWRYFDTKATDSRLKWLKNIIMQSPLWIQGQTWETVNTPQQKMDDCGPLSCSVVVSYVRWSSKKDHERLNSNDISVTNATDATELGKAARKFVRETLKKGRLPQGHHPATQDYRYKHAKQVRWSEQLEQVQEPSSTAAATELTARLMMMPPPPLTLPPVVSVPTPRPSEIDPNLGVLY